MITSFSSMKKIHRTNNVNTMIFAPENHSVFYLEKTMNDQGAKKPYN